MNSYLENYEERLMKKYKLLNAIIKKDRIEIQYLLNHNMYDINEVVGRDSYLHSAIQYGDVEVTKIFLDNGAIITPDIFPEFNYTNKNIIKLLLNYEVDLDARDFRGATYLHLAVKNKFDDIVDRLLDKKADVNAKTLTEQTVLQCAFLAYDEKIIKRLLQYDIDVKAKDQRGETPLHYAINAQNIDFARTIIEKGADVNEQNKFGLTSLHLAVLKSNVELVEFLIQYGANIASRTLEKRVPLHLAATNSSIKIVKLLLENGANVNDCTDSGITPLHIAVDTGNKEMVKFLVSENADVNATGLRDETPMNYAIAYEHEEIASYLINNGAVINHGLKEDMVLHIAVFNKNENLVRLLLENDADVTVKYKDGRTALHLATERKCFRIVKMLLEKGSEINSQMETGDTALHVAVNNKDHETFEILLEYNPNINIKNNSDETALYIAAERGFSDMVSELLNREPNLDENKSVLHSAVKGKDIEHKKIIFDLLSYGFSINFIETYTYTKSFDFMEKSICNGHTGIVEHLLKLGFDPNLPSPSETDSKSSESLLHKAVKNNQFQILKLLVNYGSNINAVDEVGHTAIFYAIKNNNLEITKFFLENNAIINSNCDLFFLSISKGNNDIIQAFLNHYKDVNIEDEFGTTALHFAAWNGDEESVELLFNRGARCKNVENLPKIHFSTEMKSSIQDYYGEEALEDFRKNIVTTPLHIAARKNHSDIVEALLEHGFNVNCRDGCGRTALHLASLFNNTGVIDVLMEFQPDFNSTDESGYTCIDYIYSRDQFISNILLDKVYSFIHNIDDIGNNQAESGVATELLVKYVARSNLMNGVSEEKFKTCYSKMLNFYRKCIVEIEQLKMRKIDQISFYDLLIKSIDTLAVYMKNENFFNICDTEIQKSGFYIYHSILKKRMRKAKERRTLLNEAEVYFARVLGLPDLVNNKIISYLHNRDLRCIKQAYESVFNQLGFFKCKES